MNQQDVQILLTSLFSNVRYVTDCLVHLQEQHYIYVYVASFLKPLSSQTFRTHLLLYTAYIYKQCCSWRWTRESETFRASENKDSLQEFVYLVGLFLYCSMMKGTHQVKYKEHVLQICTYISQIRRMYTHFCNVTLQKTERNWKRIWQLA